MTAGEPTRVFGTNRETRITFAVCVGPIVAVGLGAALEGSVLLGLAIVFIFGCMGFWYTTLKIEIAPSFVNVRRFGRVVWSADPARVHAHFGRGGQLKTHTALILESPDEAKPFEILKTMFGADQLGRMAQLLVVKQKVPGGIF